MATAAPGCSRYRQWWCRHIRRTHLPLCPSNCTGKDRLGLNDMAALLFFQHHFCFPAQPVGGFLFTLSGILNGQPWSQMSCLPHLGKLPSFLSRLARVQRSRCSSIRISFCLTAVALALSATEENPEYAHIMRYLIAALFGDVKTAWVLLRMNNQSAHTFTDRVVLSSPPRNSRPRFGE